MKTGSVVDPASKAELEVLLDSWPRWSLPLSARPVVKEVIRLGRTNGHYRLHAPGLSDDLLLRVNRPHPERLGIDRERERSVLSLTAAAGIARPFRYWDLEQRFVVFPWLSGRVWTPADLSDPDQRARLWPLIRRCHELAPDWPRRRYHAYLCHYRQQLEQAGQWDGLLEQAWSPFEAELQAFDQASWPACLVHHDLMADNIIDTGSRLYLIDWEYAACGHPDIDVWSVDPSAVREPFVSELMGWINDLWERLIRLHTVA